MARYLTRLFSNALNQLLLLFGGVFVFAFLLCFVSGMIRGCGTSVIGRAYYYLVAPGVVCHETGHAIGCLLTGTEIVRFEPFNPRDDRLGCVTFRPHPPLSPMRALEFFPATGPIWFGCLVIILLTWILSGRGNRKSAREPMFPATPGVAELGRPGRYWTAVLKSAWLRLVGVFRIWQWKSFPQILCLYLLFCVASEMTLSTADLGVMWPGFLVICILILLLNVFPPVGNLVQRSVARLRRFLFTIHSVACFVLLVNLLLLLIVFPLAAVF